jgi:streptogramin lyase
MRQARSLVLAGLLVLLGSLVVGGSSAWAKAGHKETTFTDPSIDLPGGITSGPDGDVWFTNRGNNSIGRITTSGMVSNFADPSIDSPQSITAGPDGALWFTNAGNNSIGRISTSGVVSNFADPSIDQPEGITAGPDGALWFTNSGNNSIGRISTSGEVTYYTAASVDQPEGITTGPDDELWFTNMANNSIGRITTSGDITNYAGPSIDQPDSIVTGPNGNLWFTNAGSNTLGQVSTPAEILGYGSQNGKATGAFSIETEGTGPSAHGSFSFYQSGWPTSNTPLSFRAVDVNCVTLDDGVATISGIASSTTGSEEVAVTVGAGNELALSYGLPYNPFGCEAPTSPPQLAPLATGEIDIELGDAPPLSADQILGAGGGFGVETQGTGNSAEGAVWFAQRRWPTSDSGWSEQNARVTCVAIDGSAATVTGKVKDGSATETIVAVLGSSPPASTVSTGNSISEISPGCDTTKKSAKPLANGGDVEIGN